MLSRFFGQRRVVLGLIIGILFILFSALGTLVITGEYQQTVKELTHDNAVQSNISNLSIELDDAESGQRGYLITGNVTYLAPYQTALASINSTDSSLGSSITGDANLSTLYQQLQPLISQKLAELNETIELRQTEGFAAAQAVVNTNAGQEYMTEVRQVLADMSDHITQLQIEEKSLAMTQSSEETVSAAFNAVVALGAFSFAAYTAARNLQKEERARREAELLQDILAHDIRNYNQVSRMGAELLYDMHKDNPETASVLSSILESIDGSTQLVDKGKKLGRVLSDENVLLHPTDLVKSVDNSMTLVRRASEESGKYILDKTITPENGRAKLFVMADALLDDVFTNLYSNCVKYTEGKEVYILTTIESTTDGRWWKISIADKGRGIPDEQKSTIFSRYLKTAKGNGLGMSIVHALIVDRYKGKISVKNAVPDDYTKGTIVEILLKKAQTG